MTDEEMVAWVDEDENLIKPIPLSLANSDPQYLHVEVVTLVVDHTRRVLLQQRAKTKRIFPGRWTVAAAGHVTYGDTTEVAAHRELQEEMGLNFSKLHYLFKERVKLDYETHIGYWYLGVYEGEKITVQTEEVDNYTWVSQADFDDFARNNEVSPRTTLVVQRYWSGEWDHLLK